MRMVGKNDYSWTRMSMLAERTQDVDLARTLAASTKLNFLTDARVPKDWHC